MAVQSLNFWMSDQNWDLIKTMFLHSKMTLPAIWKPINTWIFRISWKKFGTTTFEVVSASTKTASFEQKMCVLKGFPWSDLAHILGEWIKFDFAKFLFHPRGCLTSLNIRGRSRPPEVEVIFDIPRPGEVIWVPYMGVKMTSALIGL